MLKMQLKKLSCIFFFVSIFIHSNILFSQSQENKYSWLAFAVGGDYYKADFNNLIKSNPYLLNSPSNNLFFPSLNYYAGNLDKFFGEINFGGIWRNTQGTFSGYENIHNSFSHIKSGVFVNYKIVQWKKYRIFIRGGSIYSRTQINSENTKKGVVDTISSFENSIIKQWHLNLGLLFDICHIKMKREEMSFGINFGYNFPLSHARWYLPENKIEITNQKPTVDLAIFNVGLRVQFWSLKNETK